MKKFTFLFVLTVSVLLAGNAVADGISYRCTFGQQERIIDVVYQDSAQQVPCEVQYTKDGDTTTLWSAQNEIGYCETKAEEFVEQQRGWGWLCVETGVAENR